MFALVPVILSVAVMIKPGVKVAEHIVKIFILLCSIPLITCQGEISSNYCGYLTGALNMGGCEKVASFDQYLLDKSWNKY